MAYVKPGVEVRQVQRSVTPILITPDLEACVIGDGYWTQDITWDSPQDAWKHSIAPSTFTSNGSPLTFALSGVNPYYYDVTGDEQLVHVDLVGVSGQNTGLVRHLIYGSQFSVSANQITISGMTESSATKYQVKVGFRARRTSIAGLHRIESISDIDSMIGQVVSWNPLAYGTYLAMSNSNSVVNVLGLEYDINPTAEVTDKVNTILALQEVYAMAPVTHNIDIQALATHCDTMSLPENKKERIVFLNKAISYPADPKTLDAGQRDTIAANTRDANSAYQNKRVFSIHPDLGYVLESRHVSTVKPSWINASFDYFTTKSFNVYGPYAKLTTDVILGANKYKAGTEITEALWTELVSYGWGGNTGIVTVLAPVPGFYFAAIVAGQCIGTRPEQPLTNVPTAGMVEVFGSQDVFSEANLNKMAEGGTYIMTQDSKIGPIYSRHQVSTDVTSVAKRELSITKALDYTAKFVRKGLKPYIGRYNITPAFLKLTSTVLFGIGLYLTREGILNDYKVLSVSQDTISPDSILAEVNVLVKYPVNYIRISLIF